MDEKVPEEIKQSKPARGYETDDLPDLPLGWEKSVSS